MNRLLFTIATLVGLLIGTAAAFAEETPPASNWDVGPRAVLLAGAIDITHGAAVASTALGSCFGVTYKPLTIGADGCLDLELATKATPNRYGFSGMGHWRNLSAGFGGFHESGVGWTMLILVGPGIPFWQF